MSRFCGLLLLQLAAGLLAAEPSANGRRPIDAVDTVFVEEMTWMEVRDAMKNGKRTVIVPTGGVEQNGPYLATGKHNYVLRATAEAIPGARLEIVEGMGHDYPPQYWDHMVELITTHAKTAVAVG